MVLTNIIAFDGSFPCEGGVADINVYYGLITSAQQYAASVAYVHAAETFSNFGKSLDGDCECACVVLGDTLPSVSN